MIILFPQRKNKNALKGIFIIKTFNSLFHPSTTDF